jgi:hypothetical protein
VPVEVVVPVPSIFIQASSVKLVRCKEASLPALPYWLVPFSLIACPLLINGNRKSEAMKNNGFKNLVKQNFPVQVKLTSISKCFN